MQGAAFLIGHIQAGLLALGAKNRQNVVAGTKCLAQCANVECGGVYPEMEFLNDIFSRGF
jgi:hypothetical protein